MIKPRIIVTGATGRTGSVVTTQLRKAGHHVRAIGAPGRRPQRARLKAQGAEIAVTNISDVGSASSGIHDGLAPAPASIWTATTANCGVGRSLRSRLGPRPGGASTPSAMPPSPPRPGSRQGTPRCDQPRAGLTFTR